MSTDIITRRPTIDLIELQQRIIREGTADLKPEVGSLILAAQALQGSEHRWDPTDEIHAFDADNPDMTCPVCVAMTRFAVTK